MFFFDIFLVLEGYYKKNTPPTPITPFNICFGVVESSISRGELGELHFY